MSGIFWLVLALGLHVWPGMVGSARGQGSRKDDIVFNTRGVPLAGATVRVCAMPATGQPCSPLAQLYSDAGLTQAMANPTATDGMGNYFFYAAPGKYELEISGPGIITKQIPNVILPSDPSSPTFNSLSTTGSINAFTLNLSGNLTVNGSTSVTGNLASGTLNLSNQGSAPGAASPGTVNLYTKLADKRLYYKDETGTEVGPLATASGAQTNQSNTWTASQNFDADVHSKGPNPWYDIMRFGGYTGPYFRTPVNGTISSGSQTLTISSPQDFVNGNGILVWGAGPATGLPAPQAATVTPLWQQGTGNWCYAVASVDYYGGVTAAGSVGCTTTGPAAFGMQTYNISGRSSAGNGKTVTITTSAPHNIPSSGYHSGMYPQVEITGMNNGLCNTIATITGVPNSTSFTISQQQIPDSTTCSGGTVQILPEVELKWENHASLPVTNYSCNAGGSSATITVPTYMTKIPGGIPSNRMNITGASDATYNTSFAANANTGTTVTFPISCNSVTDSGNFGGTLNLEYSHAVKDHLIYRCNNTAANCALPANASSYSLVGVAEGNDTYFIDKGYGVTTAYIDQGQYSQTAPTAPTNQYLDTIITAGGGTTTLTLAAAASNSVTNVKTFHDNVPNIYQVCAALQYNTSVNMGGTIYLPAPPSNLSNQIYFPIIGNLLSTYWGSNAQRAYNCQSVNLLSAVPVYQYGTIEWNGDITGAPGGAMCLGAFYGATASSLACFVGQAYPMFHFEPYLESGNQTLTNVEVQAQGNYQSTFLWDEDFDTSGSAGFFLNNVHADGANQGYPVIIKAGFGWFWNGGGWAGQQTDYASGRDLLVMPNCAQSVYQTTDVELPYIFQANNTYHFGTAEIDGCTSGAYFAGDWYINHPLTEGSLGTAWKFDSVGTNNFHVTDEAVADSVGPGGPLFDFTNATGTIDVVLPQCYGPLFEVNPAYNFTANIFATPNGGCQTLGIDPVNDTKKYYTYNNLTSQAHYMGNYATYLQGPGAKLAAGQIPTPANAPTVTVTTSCSGHPMAGTYTYAVSVMDATGGQTPNGPSSGSITLDGSTQCAVITQPTLPVGSVYWVASAVSGPQTGMIYDTQHSSCGAGTLVKYNTINDTMGYKCGNVGNTNTSSLQTMYQTGFYGAFTSSSEATEGQCFSSAAPASCAAFINGFVTIPAGSSSVVVNTTAVTANSEISLTFDTTQGANLAVTCNTTPQQPYISARTPGTSFTISVPSNFSTNPGCIGFHIKN